MLRTAFSPPTSPKVSASSFSDAGRQAQSKPAPHREPIRFGGVGDAVSGFIGLIDRNRAAELIASDGLGMLAPRTAVAAGFRGTDDARETLIREGAGLVCVALLAGLSNQFMIHVLGNRAGFYNPHGTPAKAWISAKNLSVYSQLYDHALNTQQGILNVRQAFIQQVLQGLESGDRQLSVDGRLASLKKLLKSPEKRFAAEKALQQIVNELPTLHLNPAQQKEHLDQLAIGKAKPLRDKLLAAHWGRLSPLGQQELSEWFQPKASKDFQLKGTTNFNQQAQARVDELHQGLSPAAQKAAFLKERLNLSLHHLHGDDRLFAQSLDQIALEHGLTSVVHLKDSHESGGRILTEDQSRQTLLKELKYFLEHYVDRAADEVGSLSKKWPEQKTLLWEKLFASPSKGWRALFPQLNDGLVSGMLKAKTGYTAVPILVAIIANGATTFLNNYITQKKHQGKVFFPGEEATLRGQFGALTQRSIQQNGRFA
jgi:hypothetical protein